MSTRIVLLGLFVCATVPAGTVGAQQQPEGLGARAEQLRSKTAVPGVRKVNRGRLSTYATSRVGTTGSRLERLRRISPLAPRSAGLLPDPALPQSPIQRLLDARNLLRVRSPLGIAGTTMLGRSPQGVGAENPLETTWASSAGSSATTQTATQPSGMAEVPARFEEALADRLNTAAQQNFELGMAYFREGDLPRARYHFDLTKDLWLDQSRPYAASTIVSFEMGDYNRAIVELVRALQWAKTLDDLRIEGFVDKFFADGDPAQRRRALSRMVDSVNRFVLGAKDNSIAKLLLAYYSWLDGDLMVAVSAADEAARGVAEPRAGYIRRFRDMLAEEQRAGETPAATQPASE